MSDTSPGRRPRRLLVMRHAKAASPDDVADHDRPLAARGRRDAPEVGSRLVGSGWVPDLVLSSDALRARQTTELVLAGLAGAGAPEPSVRFVSELYEGAVHEVLHVLAEVPGDVATVLLVGHEPTMSATTAVLTGRSVRFPTSGVAQVELAGEWTDIGPDAGRLCGVHTPR